MLKKIAALLVLCVALASQRPLAQSPARIYFIDIGQGAATLIVSPAGRTLLVDGGPTGAGATRIIPLLDALGIATIDFTVLTHYHIDHDSGLTEVLNAGRVAGIAFDNGDAPAVTPPNPGSTRNAYLSYVASTSHAGVTRQTAAAGTSLDLGGGMSATIVAAGGGIVSGAQVPISNSDLNSESIAVLVELNAFDFLVSGDLTGGGSTSTAATPDVETPVAQAIGDVDVVQLNHHGSTTASNQRFLSRLKAEVAVAQASDANNFGHPHRESVNKYLNTPATAGNAFSGTGVPAAGVGPVFYQTERPVPGDDRVTLQGYAGNGTLLLQTDGTSTFSMTSVADGGVLVPPGTHTYPVDGVSSGVTADFNPTVLVSTSPAVPLATDAVVVSAAVNDRESPVTSVTLNRSVNGAAQPPIAMTLAGSVFRATIPAQPNGVRVDYSVTASTGAQTTTAASGYFSGVSSIASLRGLTEAGEPLFAGYTARIQGTVTAGSGTFGNGTNDDYVQDGGGGINVWRTSEPDVPAFQATALGQTVDVAGRIGSSAGRLRLEVTPPFASPTTPFTITGIGAGTPPPAAAVTLAQLNANPESFEGRLVAIANARVAGGSIPAAPALFDATITVSDGSGSFAMKIDHDTDIPGFATPAGAFTLTGIVQQDDPLRPFTGGYNVTPRSRVDLGGSAAGAPLATIAGARIDEVTNADGNPPPDFVPDRLAQLVKVRGTVTSIDFRGGNGIEYYIEDATGGIDVFNAAGSAGPFLIGNSVEVTGTVTQFNGLTEIDPGLSAANVTLLPAGSTPAVTPQLVTVSQLADGGAGEPFEGRLVRVDNAHIIAGAFPPANASGNVTIADATGSAIVRIDSDTDIDGTAAPAGTFSIVGVVAQFDPLAPFQNGYQLMPRFAADITTVAPVISAAPASIAFGSVNVGLTASASVTITNTSAAPVTLTAPFAIAGPDAGQFTVGTRALAPGESTTASVTFAPASAGVKRATLGIASSGGGSASVALTGTGVMAPAIAIAPATVTFGSVTVGSTAAAAITVTNISSSTVTLSPPAIAGADAAGFGAGAAVTATLAAGASTTVPVTFAPTTNGSRSATLTIATSGGGSASTTLTGSGRSGPATSVVISEIRTRGPAGGSDEFVELYNTTGAPIDIGGWRLRGSTGAGATSVRATVPAGRVIPARGHYLFTCASTQGGPYSGAVPGDQTYGVGIPDDGGAAITLADGVTIVDQVGSSNGSAFKEGTVLSPQLTTNTARSYERRPGGANGSRIDTDDNANDFVLRTAAIGSDPQNLSSAPTPPAAPPPPAPVAALSLAVTVRPALVEVASGAQRGSCSDGVGTSGNSPHPRSLYRWIFPVAVFGRSAANSIHRGLL